MLACSLLTHNPAVGWHQNKKTEISHTWDANRKINAHKPT